MLTVVETTLFQRQWPLYWTEEERGGDVVPESGGIRKVVLLTPYAKAKTDNLTGAKLKEIRRALEN